MTRSAYYNDGTSAKRHDAHIRLTDDQLLICDLNGSELAVWAIPDVSCLDGTTSHSVLRIRAANGGRARLTITDPDLIVLLRERAPQLSQTQRTLRAWKRFAIWCGISIPVIALFFLVILPTVPAIVAHAIPHPWERLLGQRVSDHFISLVEEQGDGGAAICQSNQAGQDALSAVTERLAASASADIEFRVAVLNIDVANAVALPGGYIYIFSGLIEDAQSANQVVGVLAHEMAHVVHRHNTEALIREVGLSLALSALFDGLGQTVSQALVTLSYSREAELEADMTAVELLRAAGIDARGLSSFFRQIVANGDELPSALSVFSTHPPSATRADLIEQQADFEGQAGMSDREWQALRAICHG